jgi:hypothetical protein
MRYMESSLVLKFKVVVRGFDSGKFLKVQSPSIVIWTGTGGTSPSITPKYGGSLQNFSAASAGDAAAGSRVDKISRQTTSIDPRTVMGREGRWTLPIRQVLIPLPLYICPIIVLITRSLSGSKRVTKKACSLKRQQAATLKKPPCLRQR